MTRHFAKLQHELLIEICEGDHACVEAYRPAQMLVENGYAEWRFPGRLYPTEAGRAILSDLHAERAKP